MDRQWDESNRTQPPIRSNNSDSFEMTTHLKSILSWRFITAASLFLPSPRSVQTSTPGRGGENGQIYNSSEFDSGSSSSSFSSSSVRGPFRVRDCVGLSIFVRFVLDFKMLELDFFVGRPLFFRLWRAAADLRLQTWFWKLSNYSNKNN
jgi:hypothetical protein